MNYKIRYTLYLLLISAVVWLLESAVHFFVFAEDSLADALWLNLSMHELYTRLLIIISGCLLFLVVSRNKAVKEKEAQLQNILDNILPVCVTNTDHEIVIANNSYWRIWGELAGGKNKCFEHRPGEDCHTERCAMNHILREEEEYVSESVKAYDGRIRHFIVRARAFRDYKGRLTGIIETFQDITVSKNLENEKTELVNKLQASLEKVKLLSGFLPICASCKQVRDDKGYWTQIEDYITDHSEAEFSHGICPECVETLYPGFSISSEEE